MADADMIDMIFEVEGDMLPPAYPYALWQELIRVAPQLGSHEKVGVIPFKTSASAEGMLLPRRARLIMRLPASLQHITQQLDQQELAVGEHRLRLGSGKAKSIQPYSTLHAHIVAGDKDELIFMDWVASSLDTMGVKAKLICGQAHSQATGQQQLSGFSLVLHDLSPADSLQVQYHGLGVGRQFGCGIFVPYKVISSLE